MTALAALALLLLGCSGKDRERGSREGRVQTDPESPSVNPPGLGEDGGKGESSVPSPGPSVITGPLPTGEALPERLANRDTDPLPSEALLEYQFIGRQPGLTTSYRFVLYLDGRLVLGRHSGKQGGDPNRPYDTPLPSEPTRVLDAAVVERARAALDKARFAEQPPYQRRAAKGGSYHVITARVSGVVHEVVYDAFASELVNAIDALQYE